jgi:magnesium transporter
MTPEAVRASADLSRAYLREYPEEVARFLESRSAKEGSDLLEDQPTRLAMAIMERLTPEMAAQVLARLSDGSSRSMLEGMDPSRSAILLSRLDKDVREHKLGLLDASFSSEVRELLSYPPETAGSLMDARVTTFRSDMTVQQVQRRLRGSKRRITDVFAVDEQGRLEGSASLQQLFVASPKDTLQMFLRPPAALVQPLAPREEVVDNLTQHRMASLPVTDLEGRLLGVIRYDALIQAVEDEVSADIQSMVGASKEERALSKVSFAVRKRLPWLEVNLGTAFLAASVVGLFEATIARFTALAVLLPVVAGQSGNTGAQALAVVMRGLALREVRVRHWLRLVTKEATVGLLNGIAVALTTSFFVFLWSRSVGLALVIGTSMVASMVIAGLAGAAIPILLTSLRQDPAQSSSIILTTVTDVAGFFSFLGIATLLSGML